MEGAADHVRPPMGLASSLLRPHHMHSPTGPDGWVDLPSLTPQADGLGPSAGGIEEKRGRPRLGPPGSMKAFI